MALTALLLLVGLLTPVAARLCADGVTDEAVCEQEGRHCGHCQCNSSGTWVCESATGKKVREHEEEEDDCAGVSFRKGECNDWQEGKQCGDCTCVSRGWVCGEGALVADLPLEDKNSQERELQISDEECQAINESNELTSCTEELKICGNCICVEVFEGVLGWVCARGARAQQCLGVEDGNFCRWIERGEKCGDCECMPNNQWSCPAASTSFCDNVDNSKPCRWADRGSMCGTCLCVKSSWTCPEKLCENIFPGKFCLWRNRGRTCFGCECVANQWVCPEATPTRRELCADDIFTGKFCRWRDEGRMCGGCVCRTNRWTCPFENCAMVDSCSGEKTIEVSTADFEQMPVCILPAGLRGLELVLDQSPQGSGAGEMGLVLNNAEWIVGGTDGEFVLGYDFITQGKEDYEQNPALYNGISPGADQVEWSFADPTTATVAWNPDFPSRPTVYGYEILLGGNFLLGRTGALTYRWTCNEDPALACDCAFE